MPNEQPVLIEAAINGGTTKARNPNVPTTPDEIRADALRVLRRRRHHRARAQPRHHACRARRRPVPYLEAWAPLLAERPDVLWYPTLCVAPGPGEARARATDRRAGAGAHGRASTPAPPTWVRRVPTACPRAACTPTRTPTSARRSRCARSRAGVRSSRSTNPASSSACSRITAPVGCRRGRW